MIAALLPLLSPIIDRVAGAIPDRGEADRLKAQATTELLQALSSADTQQTEINKIEAASSSVFVAGWRPAVGWVCVSGVGYQFVVRPLAQAIVTIWQPAYTMPSVPTDDLLYLLGILLGVAGLRSFEKVKGVSR